MSDILADLQGVTKLNGNTYSSAEVLGMVVRASIEIERLRGALRFYATSLVVNAAPDSPGHCDDGGLARRTLASVDEQNVGEPHGQIP